MAQKGGNTWRWKARLATFGVLIVGLSVGLWLTVLTPASAQQPSIVYGGDGPYVVIASGSHDAHPWSIVAFHRQDGAPCVGTNDSVLGGGGACFPDVPRTNLIDGLSSQGLVGLAYVAGSTANDVDEVVVRVDGRSVTLPARQVKGQAVRFFAYIYGAPGCTKGGPPSASVEAVGRNGRVIEQNAQLSTSASC